MRACGGRQRVPPRTIPRFCCSSHEWFRRLWLPWGALWWDGARAPTIKEAREQAALEHYEPVSPESDRRRGRKDEERREGRHGGRREEWFVAARS